MAPRGEGERTREIRRLWLQGDGVREIARRVGVSPERVSWVLKRPMRGVPHRMNRTLVKQRARMKVVLRRVRGLNQLLWWHQIDKLTGYSKPGVARKWARLFGWEERINAVLRKRRSARRKRILIRRVKACYRTLGLTPTRDDLLTVQVHYAEVVQLFGSIRNLQMAAGLVPNAPGGNHQYWVGMKVGGRS